MKARNNAALAVFASGEGTTLTALVDAAGCGALDADVTLVVSNNRDSGALRRARDCGLRFRHLSSLTHPDPCDLDRTMAGELESADVEWIVLAGYMKKIGPEVLARYDRRIINTHPALLPKFGGIGMYGRRVHEAVLRAGDRVTGVSVHLVTAQYDEGPVIAQLEVPVLPGDTVESLAGRVQAHEREFLVQTLQHLVCARAVGV